MLVLDKEPQMNGLDKEIGIHIHPWIIAHFGALLGSEHPRCRT